MRPPTLPDVLTLLKLEAADMTHEEIGKKFGVSQQAVSAKLGDKSRARKGPGSPTARLLPWDIHAREDTRRLSNQSSFTGLRAFLRWRRGEELTPRARKAFRHFLSQVSDGQVLALTESGFAYVPRTPADGLLVIRWPAGAPLEALQRSTFTLPLEHIASLLEEDAESSA